MGTNWEQFYLNIMADILRNGQKREGRNGITQSIFGPQLRINALSHRILPILNSRKIFPRGVLGEFATFIEGPTNISQFEKHGCHYWNKWADEDGGLTLDYGRDWADQFGHVFDSLTNNPGDRRMLVNTWDHKRLPSLSLPSCHFSYQFYRDGNTVAMLWNQRSADWCVGVPSDILLAAVMLIAVARHVNLVPGEIIMQFGDAHIYEEHRDKAFEQIGREPNENQPRWKYSGSSFFDFVPAQFTIHNYKPQGAIKYELKT